MGKGCIGPERLRSIALHPKLQGLLFILETPNELSGWRAEIATVHQWMTAPSVWTEIPVPSLHN